MGINHSYRTDTKNYESLAGRKRYRCHHARTRQYHKHTREATTYVCILWQCQAL